MKDSPRFRFNRPGLAAFALLFVTACITALAATSETGFDHIELPERYDVETMISGDRPAGVVYHVYEHEENALETVLPRIIVYTEWIQEAWPGIPVAVVTHGSEMLALAAAKADNYQQIHEDAQGLGESGVIIHVCGAFAETMGLGMEDFPQYIDVVPYGPAQIEDYLHLGYKAIDVELTSWN